MKKQDFKVLKTKDLYPFPDNPFHVVEDETLSELAESIKEFGIVTPIITRPKEDGNGYEVIAGQRRVRASELAGINTVPAFVLPLDRDRAIITLVDSNLQRENILPSERAFAYKMKSEAMKRQGFRTDLTSSQVVTKLRTDDKVAQGFGVGRMTVQRFIRLTELIPPILQMVDEGKIALTPAVELSFLKKDEQENLFATMESEEATPSLSQAHRMKSMSQSGRLDMDTIFAIMTEEKGNQRKHLIGYLPEERGLYPKKKVIEQMVYLGRIRGISKSEAVANSKKWLKRLGVLEYENAKLETLSKGNQQKVQLASTLVCDPDIVILDEPFSGLDPVNSRILQDVVMELIGQNKIVIFSSHQMSYVEEFCKDIVIINKGDVVLSGDLDNIKREFGKNQLVVSAVDKTLDDLENIINEHMSDILEITGRTKEELIIKNVADVSRKQILSKFISENIEIERFETYKPSLNDIFVSKVGDADEKEAAE